MISVIIPLYNKAEKISNTLQSVLEQTFQDFEIVVVNDGSTDNSVAEVYKIKDPRIRLVHQENAGVSAARNRGIQEARFDLIAFLDADDNWKPNYLESQYELYKKYPTCSVYVTNYEFHHSADTVIPTIIRKLPFKESDGILINYFEVAYCSHPPICSISIMVRKEAIQAIGGFPSGIILGEDLITWAKLACSYSIAYSIRPLAIYNFASQKTLIRPKRKPDINDPVGILLDELLQHYPETPYLKEYSARWHKMRMVTFVRFGMKTEASNEFKQITRYVKPTKIILFWKYLNLLPLPMIRMVLNLKAILTK